MKGGCVPVPRNHTARGLGCVASKGVRNVRFRKCGNDRTYGRIFGCVARKGLREEKGRRWQGRRQEKELASGDSSMARAEGAGWFQNGKNPPTPPVFS